jgi:ribosomal-protein-alanine N-acetyltransferase
MTSVHDQLAYSPMVAADVDEVVALEESVYPHPWTRGNFIDSLASDYIAWTVRDADGWLVGYFLMMDMVDEAHLLNVAVCPSMQKEKLGLYLLDKIAAIARGMNLESVLLEVRPSNLRALNIYERYGYKEIGRRKNYYPAHNGQREDAIVMRLAL